VSERAPKDYLSMLRDNGVSYIVAGESAVDLVKAVNLLADGRHEIAAVFDGMNAARKAAVPLKLKSIERREKDTLWLRYEVVRSE
jgi:hypothetical protein